MLSASSLDSDLAFWCGTTGKLDESIAAAAGAIPVGNSHDDSDDTFDDANPIGVGDSIVDSIEVGDDVDIFEFTVLADQVVSFDIDIPNEDLDSYIKVFRGDGQELAVNNDAIGIDDEYHNKESFVTVTFTTAGTYYVAVSAPPNVGYDPFTGEDPVMGTTTGGYQLTLTSGSGGGDTDPDDQISQAQSIPVGGSTSTTINVETDVDMYVFTVNNTASISIDIDAPIGPSTLDSYIRLFTSSGVEITANDNDAGPDPELSGDESFLQVSLTPGVYYVGVSSSPNAAYSPIDGGGDSGGNTTGSYTLTITASQTPINDGDDQLSEATPLGIEDGVAAAISSSDDVDMYAISVPGPMTLSLDVDAENSALDSYLRLFDSSGNQLGANNNALGLGLEFAANESYFEFTFTSAGTYYVGVSSNANTVYNPSTGEGDVGGLTSGAYSLTVISIPTDPDDQITEALPLGVNLPVSGVLSTSSDVDMYMVSANANETLNFDIDRPTGSLNSYLRLFNAAGVELATNDNGTGPDPEYSANESLLSFTFPTSGTYYIGVSALANTQYNANTGTDDNNGLSVGQYTLTLTTGVLPTADLDDQISEAIPVTVGAPISRVISTAADVDMYSFTVADGETLTFDIDVPADSDLNSYIRLFRDDGFELSSNDDDPLTLTEESWLQYSFPTGGTYYLGVSSAINGSYDAITGEGDADGETIGGYTLLITTDMPPDDGDPDDQIAEAVSIALNVVTPGAISTLTDVDMFKITVVAGDELSFDVDVTGAEWNPFMYLFDENGQALISDDNSFGPNPEGSNLEPFFSYTFTFAGTYYIGISAYNNTGYHPVTGVGDVNGDTTGSYNLTITPAGTGFDDLDDEIREAMSATIGSAMFGTIESPTDVDMYEVIVGDNETLSFDIDVPSADLNSFIRLFTEAGDELAVNDDGTGAVPEYSSQESFLVYPFLTPGKYYIGVSSAGNNLYDPVTGQGDGSATTMGNYVLTINLSDADDQIGEAQPIAAGDSVGGNISSEMDVDMYAVTVTPGQTLRFDIDLPGSNLNSYIRLFNSQGDLLAENDDAVGPGEEFSIHESFLQYPFGAAGTYYLGVSAFNNINYGALDGENDFNGQSTGGYILSILSNTPIATPQIIDNSEPGFTTQGQWSAGGGQGVGRNDNIVLAFGEPFLPTDIATWTFNLASAPGRYRVSATWFTNTGFPGLFTDAARYEVSDPGVGAIRGTAVMNQKQFPNDSTSEGSTWEDLGTFDIMGSTLVVKLFSTNDNQTYVVADAIRIERIGNLPSTGEINVIANGETGINVLDGVTDVDFGTTDFTQPLTKTFTITNSGLDQVSLDSLVSVTGNVFSVIAQPGASLLNPGQSTTFTIRMNASLTGEHSAVVSFANGDGNEDPFNFTVSGTVRTTFIIDDGDPGFFMTPSPAAPGGWGQAGGPGREFDFKFNRNNPGTTEYATWTFTVTPGVYKVSTTWPFGSPGYDDASPFTIYDGSPFGIGVVRGGRNIDQKNAPAGGDYPSGFQFPLGTSGSTNWERIDVVNIHSTTLTVYLPADDVNEFVLADSILIDRLGDLPIGEPEIVVIESGRNVNGTVNYGTTELTDAIEKTFTITNSGSSVLNITSPISISGATPGAFQLVGGPTSNSIAPGGSSTFVVRLTAAYEGSKSATISFTTNDSDEDTFSIDLVGNVLNYHFIDDQDTAAGFSSSGMATLTGIGYLGDTSYANSSTIQGPASATWSFTNVSPGDYYIALTWFDTSSNSNFYSDNTPVSVQDGLAVEGLFSINQKVKPSSFDFVGASWHILGFFNFSNPTVTVTMTNTNTSGVVLADGAILVRIGGGIPAGNSELESGGSLTGDSGTAGGSSSESSGTQLRSDSSEQALDQALLNTAYWDELDDVAMLLTDESAQSSDLTAELAAGGEVDAADPLEDELIDLLV